MALELQHTWHAWYDHASPGRNSKSYEQTLHKICSFFTVQEFWGCYNNLPALQTLSVKSGYHIMKENVKPMWEDSANGGVWTLKVNKDDGAEMWKETLLSLVSGQYSEAFANYPINGISITNRQSEYLLTIWTQTVTENLNIPKYFAAESIELTNSASFKACNLLISQSKQ